MKEVDSAADEMIEKIRLRGLQRDLDKVNAESDKLDVLANELTARRDAIVRSIYETEQQLEQIQLAKLKWKPKGGEWLISNSNIIGRTVANSLACMAAGKYRNDCDLARRAASEIDSHSRLLAYRDEFDPKFEWVYGGDNFYVTQGVDEWRAYNERMYKTPGVVYMSKDVASDLVEKLNKGIVEL